MELTTGEEQAEHIANRKRINAEIISFMRDKEIRATPAYSVGDELVPAVLDHVAAGNAYLRDPRLLKAGDAFSAVRNVDTVYGIVDKAASESATADMLMAHGLRDELLEMKTDSYIFFVKQDRLDEILSRGAKKEFAIDLEKARAEAYESVKNRIASVEELAEARYAKLVRQYAESNEIPVEEVEALFETLSNKLIEMAHIGRHGKQETLRKVFESGKIKSQFESGTSSGYLNEEFRAEVEYYYFRYDKTDFPKELRPIYGALKVDVSHGEMNAGGHYGAIYVELHKDRLLDRTTLFFTDTLDAHRGHVDESNLDLMLRLGRLNNPREVARAMATQFSEYVSKRNIPSQDIVEAMMRWAVHYTEIEMHGGVFVDDIAGVYFFTTPDPEIVAMLKKSGKFARRVAGDTWEEL